MKACLNVPQDAPVQIIKANNSADARKSRNLEIAKQDSDAMVRANVSAGCFDLVAGGSGLHQDER